MHCRLPSEDPTNIHEAITLKSLGREIQIRLHVPRLLRLMLY